MKSVSEPLHATPMSGVDIVFTAASTEAASLLQELQNGDQNQNSVVVVEYRARSIVFPPTSVWTCSHAGRFSSYERASTAVSVAVEEHAVVVAATISNSAPRRTARTNRVMVGSVRNNYPDARRR